MDLAFVDVEVGFTDRAAAVVVVGTKERRTTKEEMEGPTTC